jgi:hypothetical protein
MPGMLLRIAVSITVAPTSASTVREVPPESVKVILGTAYPLIPAQAGTQFFKINLGNPAQSCRPWVPAFAGTSG